MVFTIGFILNKIMIPSIFESAYPRIKANSSSNNSRIIYIRSKLVPVIRASPMVMIIVNKIITRKSVNTVTPIAVWVNGPFALISCTTAIIDAGDRAIKMVPANRDTATFDSIFIYCIKGMYSAIKNTAKLPNMKVILN